MRIGFVGYSLRAERYRERNGCQREHCGAPSDHLISATDRFTEHIPQRPPAHALRLHGARVVHQRAGVNVTGESSHPVVRTAHAYKRLEAALDGLQSACAAEGIKPVGATLNPTAEQVLAIPYEEEPFCCEGYIFKKGEMP